MKKTALHYIISTVLIVIGMIAFCVMVSEPADGHRFTVLPNLCALGVLVVDFKVGGWLAKHNIIQTDLFNEDKN